MDLIVFDLDGTLLNRESQLSAYTRDTLQLLRQRGIAYTVATGRTLHASRDLLQGQGFDLPHVYKNGVKVLGVADSYNPYHRYSTYGGHYRMSTYSFGLSLFTGDSVYLLNTEGSSLNAVIRSKPLTWFGRLLTGSE